MENPEFASVISELSPFADDASELVQGLLQVSINAGLQTEMDAHLGYSHCDRKTKARVETAQSCNHRNGSYTKTVNSGYRAVEVTVPGDSAGTFAPRMVPKGARRLTELDDMIISLYAGGDERARYLAPSRNHRWRGYEPGYDQHHYRRGLRRGHDLAKPPIR